jgi:hypothetical protein
MIRAFLTKIGEEYLGHSFNTGSGKGKRIWLRIKEETFENKCAYCGLSSDPLTIEHLVMFNRSQCGLHHPGNIVPCCKSCNKRKTHTDTKKYFDWREQLESICKSIDELKERKKKIQKHIKDEKYPDLTEDEMNALRAVSVNLYERTSSELEKSINLFKDIDKTLVRRR